MAKSDCPYYQQARGRAKHEHSLQICRMILACKFWQTIKKLVGVFDPNIWQTTRFYCNVQWGNSPWCLHQCKYVIKENHQNQWQEYPLTT
ncbi:unnamed protein product [Prunus brigantina]